MAGKIHIGGGGLLGPQGSAGGHQEEPQSDGNIGTQNQTDVLITRMTQLQLDYIWWNKDTNTIELWGPHYRLNFAKKIMNKKLEEYTEKKEKNKENIESTNNKKYVKILTRQNP